MTFDIILYRKQWENMISCTSYMISCTPYMISCIPYMKSCMGCRISCTPFLVKMGICQCFNAPKILISQMELGFERIFPIFHAIPDLLTFWPQLYMISCMGYRISCIGCMISCMVYMISSIFFSGNDKNDKGQHNSNKN